MVKDDAIVCAPSPFIATDDWFLLGVLNSKAADWYVHQVGVTRSGGYMEYKPVFVEQIPIPQNVPEKERTRVASLAQAIQNCQGEEIYEYEKQINDMVFGLYGICNKEILALQ